MRPLTALTTAGRPTVATIDLGAIEGNVRALVGHVAPSAVCAVVKANGYGHGAVEVARAALRSGATWLAVALVEEGAELREAGIAAPILLLSEPPPGSSGRVVSLGLTATVYSLRAVVELAEAARSQDAPVDVDVDVPVDVHVKVDTGMHRVGAQPGEVLDLLAAIAARPGVRHTGTFTHLAIADQPDDPFTALQLKRFDGVLDAMRSAGFAPGIVHAANSAGAIAHPAARRDLVRCGIAVYGNDPDLSLRAGDWGVALLPALSLRSAVSHVKVVDAGERLSYGLAYVCAVPSIVATVPIGYADGLPRRLSAVGGEVLIGGRRRPMAGRITMDQMLVDCGPADTVGAAGHAERIAIGDEVVLIGRQGPEEVTAWEWASLLGTIAYEITCGVSGRVPRR